LGAQILRVLLREDCLEHGDDAGPLLGWNMGERVAHPMNAAALHGGVKHARRRRPQELVVVGYDFRGLDPGIDAAQAAIGERTKEARPKRLGFRRPGGDAEHLAPAVGVHPHSHYCRGGHDASGLAGLYVGGVYP